jgi:hypothetical protein
MNGSLIYSRILLIKATSSYQIRSLNSWRMTLHFNSSSWRWALDNLHLAFTWRALVTPLFFMIIISLYNFWLGQAAQLQDSQDGGAWLGNNQFSATGTQGRRYLVLSVAPVSGEAAGTVAQEFTPCCLRL